MANIIRVIGIGPGNPNYMTSTALEAIKGSDVLVGGRRVLEQFSQMGKETFVIGNNLAEMVQVIRDRCTRKNVAVVASGDPSFYGIMEYLKKNFQKSELEVIPGLSSVQVACARLGISWHDARFFSVHGRGIDGLGGLVKTEPKVIVLTDPTTTPAVIAKNLVALGIKGKKVCTCENLTYPEEQIGEYDLDCVPETIGRSGCVVVIIDD